MRPATLTKATIILILGLLMPINTGCESGLDVGSGSDGDGDGDSDADSDTTPTGPTTNLSGRTMAPSGTFPIAGALVYVTKADGEDIPDNVYCYECDDMTGKNWTLSNADGTFTLEEVPAGSWNIVTRKGFFQRQRAIEISEGAEYEVPVEFTTLPAEESVDGLDRIPNYAVLLNGYDRAEDMLAKLGIGEMDSSGHLQAGTEQFDLYNDGIAYAGYPNSSQIFSSQEALESYHMVFFPCKADSMNANNYHDMVAEFVVNGGRIYSSCWASQWIERPFPNVVTFNGNEGVTNPGDVGEYDTYGRIEDPDMRQWLAGVTTEDPDHFDIVGSFILVDQINNVDNGWGLDEDNGVVVPRNWVTDLGGGGYDGSQGYPGHPMNITFNVGCGKTFYSVYQVVEASPSTTIRPQEYILLYLILEVGVCDGTYVIE